MTSARERSRAGRQGADAEDPDRGRSKAAFTPSRVRMGWTSFSRSPCELLHTDAYLTSLHRGEAEVARYQAFLHKGDIAAAARTNEEIGRLGRVLRRPETIWHYDRDCAQLAFHGGDFPAAQTKFQELSVRSRQLRLPYGKFFFIMQVLLLAYERTGVLSLQTTALEWRSEFEWASALPSFQAHELRFVLESGNVAEARRAFDSMAEAGFENITRELGYLNALAQLSLVAVALEDRDRAAILLRSDAAVSTPQHADELRFLSGVGFVLPRPAGEPPGPLGRRRRASRGSPRDERRDGVLAPARTHAVRSRRGPIGREREGGPRSCDRARGRGRRHGAAPRDGPAHPRGDRTAFQRTTGAPERGRIRAR